MTDMEVDAAVPASSEKMAPVLPAEAAAAASPAADEKPSKKTPAQVEVLEKLFEGDSHPTSPVHPPLRTRQAHVAGWAEYPARTRAAAARCSPWGTFCSSRHHREGTEMNGTCGLKSTHATSLQSPHTR